MSSALSCCEEATPDHAAYFSQGEFLNFPEALSWFSGAAQGTAGHVMRFRTPGPPTLEPMPLGEKHSLSETPGRRLGEPEDVLKALSSNQSHAQSSRWPTEL